MIKITFICLILINSILAHSPSQDFIQRVALSSTITGKVTEIVFVLKPSSLFFRGWTIIFSTEPTTPNIGDPSIEIISNGVLKYNYTFTAPGNYNIYLRPEKEDAVLQNETDTRFTITGPVSNAITAIEGKPIAKTEAILNFVISTGVFKQNDEIVFSRSNSSVVATDPKYQLSTDPNNNDKLEAAFTFPCSGKYNVFVSNNSGTSKQGTVSVTVLENGPDEPHCVESNTDNPDKPGGDVLEGKFTSIHFALLTILFLI